MDADTRHELKQNELARMLREFWDFRDKRATAWLVVILVIALGYAGYKIWGWHQRARVVASYQTLLSVNAADAALGEAPLTQLRQLIVENHQPGLVALSRLNLAQGLEARGRGADGDAKLSEAETEYRAVLDMPAAPDQLKAAALYRLGLLYETRQEFDKAREAYTRLREDVRFAGSPLVDLAGARRDQLDGLAVPIEFEPGVKPLPATQPATAPASQLASQPTTAEVPGPPDVSPVPPTTPPAEAEGAPGEETTQPNADVSPSTQSSKPQ